MAQALPVNRQSFVGNLTQIYVAGVPIIACQSVTVTEDLSQAVNSGMGDNRPIEYVPGLGQVTVQLTHATMRRQSLAQIGVAPATSLTDILKGYVFQVAIFDKVAATIIKAAIGCVYAQGTLTVDKHVLGQFNATFMGRDVYGNMFEPATSQAA